jgi:hypothetical protein
MAVLWGVFSWGSYAQVEGMKETRVTLDLEGVPLSEALEKLSQAGGTRVEILPPVPKTMPKATVHVKDVTVLNAMREICSNVKMTPARSIPANRAEGYCLTEGAEIWKAPVSDKGWAMVLALDARREGMRAFAGGESVSASTVVSMMALTERSKAILRYSAEAQVEEAMTDKGVSLAPENMEDAQITQFGRTGLPFTATLKPAPAGAKLTKLKGKIWAVAEESSEYWTINSPASGVKESKAAAGGALTMTHEGKKESLGKNFTLTMEQLFERGKSRAILLAPEGILDRMEALDGNDRAVFKVTRKSSSSAANSQPNGDVLLKVTLEFEATPNTGVGANVEVSKIRIRVPGEVKAFPIPFEFKDLELP